MVITVNEGITSAGSLTDYEGSFLCGRSGNAVCLTCHSSCTSCSSGHCVSCKDSNAVKSADGAFCHCSGAFGRDTSDYHEVCAACDGTCGSCEVAATADSCYSCKAVGALLSNAAGGSCSCGEGFPLLTATTVACLQCHESCFTCVDGTSSGCTQCTVPEATLSDVSGGTCSCGGSYALQTPATTSCVSCHHSCDTCVSATASGCSSCKYSGATGGSASGGTCNCGAGFVPQEPHTGNCVACYSGCIYCVDTSQAACLKSKDLVYFATNLASYNLPLLDQTDGLFCYRQSVANLECNPLSAAVTGPVTSDGSGLHLSPDQCYELLRANWLSIKFWFGRTFTAFNPPATATEAGEYALKTVLWLWVLQFGPSALTYETKWQELVGTFNSASLDWGQLLAWGGAAPGYLAGGTTHTFPTELTPSSGELALFNQFSTVCDTENCGHKAECLLATPTSVCATS